MDAGIEPSGSLVMLVGWFDVVAVTLLAGVMWTTGDCFEPPYCRKSIIEVQSSEELFIFSRKQSP